MKLIVVNKLIAEIVSTGAKLVRVTSYFIYGLVWLLDVVLWTWQRLYSLPLSSAHRGSGLSCSCASDWSNARVSVS